MSVQTVADVATSVAWRDRRLVFQQQTLNEIVAEFNRYNKRQIQLEGVQGTEHSYTGVFDANDLEALVQVLSRDNSLVIARTEQGFLIRSR